MYNQGNYNNMEYKLLFYPHEFINYFDPITLNKEFYFSILSYLNKNMNYKVKKPFEHIIISKSK